MIFFPLSFTYMELAFHIAVYHSLDSNIIHPVLFGIACGLSMAFLCSFWHKIANAVIAYALWSIISVYYIAQFVYYKIFRTFLSLVSIGGAQDAMNFKTVLFSALKGNWYVILILLAPLISLIVLGRLRLSFDRQSAVPVIKHAAASFLTAAVSWLIAVLLLAVHGTAAYSPYALFHGGYVLELSMNRLGVMVTTARDGITMITGNSPMSDKTFELAESSSTESSTEESDTEAADKSSDGADIADTVSPDTPRAQIDDSIDFTALYNSTGDEDLKNLSAYFSGVEPTYTNEYTGMFEGYNVVFITAESLSTYGISEEATPTLYKILHDGFEFNSFYCPLWYHSTIDGEYANCLSQYPASSKWSFAESADTYQPYALGNVLNSLGYSSFAYHDFDATYYDRTKTHPNMGYTTFKAIDAGLELTFHNMYSDLECMETVYGDFINEEHFNMYFMSFSGHLPYDYDYQYMCLKNRDEAEAALEGHSYSDEAIAYVAAQMELDKALEFLMDKLDEAGKLDNTLFVVAPDHYPYGLSDGVYNELAGKDIESDPFELHSNAFGIWSSSMDKKIEVDKLCSSVDILPTVLNLLGADYDSRLLAGRDIMSDADELVIFANQSFITDKVKYDAGTGEVSYLVPQSQVPDGYIDDVISEVENRLYISDEIINTDYFGFVYGVDGE